MSDARYQALTHALDELVKQMQGDQLWSSTLPDAKSLASTQPFCVDTLRFEQWLQFVMVPTFVGMIDSELPLPNQCDIYPMAQQVWQAQYPELQVCIKAIDEVISAGISRPSVN